jgi:hypothetical protein
MRAAGEITNTLRIPLFPFIYGVFIACLLLCGVLALDVVKSLKKVAKK